MSRRVVWVTRAQVAAAKLIVKRAGLGLGPPASAAVQAIALAKPAPARSGA